MAKMTRREKSKINKAKHAARRAAERGKGGTRSSKAAKTQAKRWRSAWEKQLKS